MNDSNPKVELRVTSRKLSPSGLNSVIVFVHTKSEEIFINPTTGHQTRRYTTVSPCFLVVINLHSSSPDDIRTLLHDDHRFVNYHWLCDYLASEISTAAIDLGFGYNGFTMTMVATVTYHTVTVMSNEEESSLQMVLLRRMKAEELKSLKMETEPCSICLENLTCPKPNELITRMTCSHVFHSQCLLEWLTRKNTCPLCRTLLY